MIYSGLNIAFYTYCYIVDYTQMVSEAVPILILFFCFDIAYIQVGVTYLYSGLLHNYPGFELKAASWMYFVAPSIDCLLANNSFN